MFPIRDNIPSRTVPFINYAMIVICGGVFLAQQQAGNQLVEQYGMIPVRVQHPAEEISVERMIPVITPGGQINIVKERLTLTPLPFPPVLTLLTCIFLHGGWLHFVGNMWFLYIFGDNVEDRFGHIGYLILYLVCGIFASAAHLISSPESTVPTIGASGAIAGVMGAYMVLYPHARVLAIIPIFVLIQAIVVPAGVFLGLWFILQFLQSLAADNEMGGVAWWAHIGGFVLGAVVALLLRNGPLRPPADTTRDFQVRSYRPL
ncbi:MAG: rhomboid family intramembrane serine protease [Planctomycetales bacterium]|nr:rhomboid family intramembrane serine protease [Planctomycetales bacterium]